MRRRRPGPGLCSLVTPGFEASESWERAREKSGIRCGAFDAAKKNTLTGKNKPTNGGNEVDFPQNLDEKAAGVFRAA